MVDGPALPVGDLVYVLGVATLGIIAIASIVEDNSHLPDNLKTEASSSKSSKSIELSSSGGMPEPPNRNDKGNWQKVKERLLEVQLRKQGLTPHQLKDEYVGAPYSKYEIYYDKSDALGRLAIFTHSTKEFVMLTDYYLWGE